MLEMHMMPVKKKEANISWNGNGSVSPQESCSRGEAVHEVQQANCMLIRSMST